MTHTIDRTEYFKLESHWNGAAFTLTNLVTNEDIYFQGDDALYFEQEYEAYSTPENLAFFGCPLAELWFNYAPDT